MGQLSLPPAIVSKDVTGLEDVNCLLCGNGARRIRFQGTDRAHHLPGTFTLVECTRCGFLYLSPRPDSAEIQAYYPSDYQPFHPALHEERSVIRRLDRRHGLRRRCELIQRFKPTGHLLDVGCATGDFLATMSAYPGWKVQGIEPHPGAVARARDSYGLRVDCGTIDDAPYGSESFDVVSLWDAIEHVPWPVDTLRRLRDLLRPTGLIVLGLPNRDSLDARIFGPYWAGLDIPRHCSVFSAGHIIRALTIAGFVEPRLFNLTGSYHAFAQSLRLWLSGGQTPSRARNLALSALTSLPGRLAMLPYCTAVKWLKRGTTMIVLASRPA